MIPNIIDFVTDPQLLGLNISPAQRTLLKAIYGLRLDKQELEVFRFCTGRDAPSPSGYPEVTVLSGARGGKDSRIAAPIVVYEAVFGGHDRRASRGERPVIPLVAQDARASKIAFSYIRDYFEKSPMLSSMVEDTLASEIILRNGVTITCFPCTLRSLRGWSIPVGVMDEVAFFRLEGQANSDEEIQASIRRGMIAFPSTRLIKISTPYMKSGILFDDFARAFGKNDPDLLVWRASSTLMNPALRADRLAREQRLDAKRFAREYEAEFAEDVAAFLVGAWIDAALNTGRFELLPRHGERYLAAVDPSGGGEDAMTLAICHVEHDALLGSRVVQDVMKGWRRPRDGSQLNLEGVVTEIASLVKSYGLSTVFGDRYAGDWVRQRFRAERVRYDLPMHREARSSLRHPAEYKDQQYLDRSAAYLEIEPLFSGGRIVILDHPQLVRELKNLERRPQTGGRDRVDHPPGGHDDFAYSLALCAALLSRQTARPWAAPVLPSGIELLGYPRPSSNDAAVVGGSRRVSSLMKPSLGLTPATGIYGAKRW